VIPKSIIWWLLALLGDLTQASVSVAQDVLSAVLDHLVSDLDKETSHTLVGVVISGDSMNHLDTIHESWKGLLDGLWCSIIKGLNELLKGLEILDVIFSFVESFSNSELNASPLGG
jgi:hypothetical protein